MTNEHSTADQEVNHCKSREIVSMLSWAKRVSKRFAYKIGIPFRTERRYCLRQAMSIGTGIQTALFHSRS